MDPMMGGMPADPAMDPMMGGMPPEPAAPPEDIRKIIQEELASANSAASPDMGGPAGAKAKKFDPAELDVKLYNMEKLIVAISNALGVSLPPESLLGPPPEGATPPEAAGAPGPGPEVGGDPSSIKPISPIQPATPAPGEDAGNLKISSAVPTVGQPIAMNAPGTAAELFNKTAAMAAMARSINNRG